MNSAEPVRAYIEKHGITQGDFAKMMGVCQSSVSQWVRGIKGISFRNAHKMQKKTKGEITVRALYPKVFE